MISELSSAVKNAIENFKVPNEVGFGTLIAPVMIEANFKNNEWSELAILPFGDITIPPTAKVFHYAQEIFEGLKAYKSPMVKLCFFDQSKMQKDLIIQQDEWPCLRFLKICFFQPAELLQLFQRFYPRSLRL